MLKVLEEQVTTLLKACTNQKLPVPEFLTAFLRCHGHSIRLSDYGANSVVELIHKIPNAAQVQCTVVHWSGEMTSYFRHIWNWFKALKQVVVGTGLVFIRSLVKCFLLYSRIKVLCSFFAGNAGRDIMAAILFLSTATAYKI